MEAIQAPLLLLSSTFRPLTFSSTTIEEEEYNALYDKRHLFKLLTLLFIGIISFCQLYAAICSFRQLHMIENGAAAIDELRDRLKLEFTDGDVLGLALDMMEGIARDEGKIAEWKNEDIP
ncbi:601530aa-4663-4b8c-8290-1de687267a75 [Sclerotinia trifoliorum]|uniref:601530aa-4663-4b8c-8290-1de687267a75 n=1 Tax=Sclerotinia trifoliorum TaxID=28548 RepID=A0A8H2VX68_9HELO|nr:601530aa-4663-4b8c-8290-1de687267a75 [Sclerotinia trifoliorum]